MLAAGLLDEVRAQYQRGDLTPDLPAVRAVGYRQLWRHLAGECALEDAVDKAVAATRQLAKRQLTWLRKWPDLNWIYTDAEGNLADPVEPGPGGAQKGDRPIRLALNYLDWPPL
jgi:tRNA dimethylallyltransferase